MTILKKTTLYIIAGALATLALVSSVVVGVLTAVAVFNASLPLIAGLVGLAIFSAATIALSAVAINKNNTISQQEKFESRVAQRKEEEAKARDPVPDVIALPYKLSSVPDVIALPDKNFESRVAQRKQEEKNAKAELKAEGLLPDVIELPYKLSSVPDIIALPYKDNQGWAAWGKEKARNWIPSLKTAGCIAGGAGLLAGATYIAANGGFTVADNSSNAVGNSTNSTKSGASIPNLSSTCPRLTMQCQIDEYSKTLADAKKFAKNNFGMSEEDNTNNKNESQSVVGRILSVPRNLLVNISNFISGANKSRLLSKFT
ncbi:hypothetical protein [Wolbachia endosymbiont of Cantharis cryptica]|uniref:hypothetical protein n=1 Tax=Wolbachia endosymbiont of Cantharis cryptica TaxID=3066132 RepID=UPI00376EECA3